MSSPIEFLFVFLRVLSLVVLVDAVSSWIVSNPNAFPRNVTSVITRPLYAPIRAVLKPEALGGIDISPLVVIVVLNLVAQALARAAAGF